MTITHLNRYVDLEIIERRGIVVGIDLRFDRKVMIKLLPSYFSDSGVFKTRFVNTLEEVQRLRHKNIAPIYDFGIVDEAPYIVMKYLGRETLSDLINHYKARGGGIPLHEVTTLFDKIAIALEFAHQKGQVHQDIRPSNIFLPNNDKPVITDFGMVDILAEATDMSLTDGIFGPPPYLSPERISDQTIDKRCDIYALGIITYQMVTGEVPFDGDMVSVYLRHINEQPKNPKLLNNELPDSMANIIMKALAKQPDDRFISVAEMADDFRKSSSHIAHENHVATKKEINANQSESSNTSENRTGSTTVIQTENTASTLLWLAIGGLGVIALLIIIIVVAGSAG